MQYPVDVTNKRDWFTFAVFSISTNGRSRIFSSSNVVQWNSFDVSNSPRRTNGVPGCDALTSCAKARELAKRGPTQAQLPSRRSKITSREK